MLGFINALIAKKTIPQIYARLWSISPLVLNLNTLGSTKYFLLLNGNKIGTPLSVNSYHQRYVKDCQ